MKTTFLGLKKQRPSPTKESKGTHAKYYLVHGWHHFHDHPSFPPLVSLYSLFYPACVRERARASVRPTIDDIFISFGHRFSSNSALSLARLTRVSFSRTVASVKKLMKWRAVFWRQDGNKYHNHMFFRILFSCSIARSIQPVWFQTPPLDSYSANDSSMLDA